MCADVPLRFRSHGAVISRTQKAVISMVWSTGNGDVNTCHCHVQMIACVWLLTVLERLAEGLNRRGLACGDGDRELKIDSVGRWRH